WDRLHADADRARRAGDAGHRVSGRDRVRRRLPLRAHRADAHRAGGRAGVAGHRPALIRLPTMPPMLHALAIFAGAGVGALARWRLGLWLNTQGSLLPWGTLAANL